MNKFLIPAKPKQNYIYISPKINIITVNQDYQKVISIDNIQVGEIIIEEYPVINLFGEKNIDKALQVMQKYIIYNEKQLYPRTKEYNKTSMIKDIHKIIKNTDSYFNFYKKYNKETIEFYYAKYLYNSFEGNRYGPLTLPVIAKLNHSCNNNVDYNFNPVTGTMIVTSNQNIKKNTEICDNYLSNKNIPNHKYYLYQHYGFTCNC